MGTTGFRCSLLNKQDMALGLDIRRLVYIVPKAGEDRNEKNMDVDDCIYNICYTHAGSCF